MRVGQKGISIFVIMALGFLFFLIIPTVLFTISKISKTMFQIIMAFLIIEYVRNMGIEGPLMWILSGILIYFLVYKYPTFTATFYTLVLMIGFGFTSAIIWGSSLIRGKILARKAKK